MNTSWQPTASMANLRLRAQVLAKIRAFFSARDVMEVETPLLCAATSTAPYLDSFSTHYQGPGVAVDSVRYLQTSPEFAMKRLLAAESGPIYQICKSFRNGELGRYHNPEFTMLEWYRPGFDYFDLMAEVEALVVDVLGVTAGFDRVDRITYAAVFSQYLGLNVHNCSIAQLQQCALAHDLPDLGFADKDRDTYLSLLLAHLIEPTLGVERPIFVYDFPASQAMLAKVRAASPNVAERFELYFKGVELANGFQELTDAAEQTKRFEQELAQRVCLQLTAVAMDRRFLAALNKGLPECSGVAVGVDRLLMLAAGVERLADVVAFPFDWA